MTPADIPFAESPCLPIDGFDAHAPVPADPPADRPAPPPFVLQPDMVLYEDHLILVINKPAPLLTQAPPGVPSLEAGVKAYLKEKYGKAGGVYLGIPHRLDRPVSGVIVFARSTKAAQRVHAQFQERQVRKAYWAAVEGAVEPSTGVWDDWMRKIAAEARVVPAAANELGAKLATLDYTVVRPLIEGGGTLVEFAPRTGRMHQLRVQAAWRGHPIFGDVQYGSSRPFGPPWELPRERVIALHARRLTLAHPVTRDEMTFTAPVPPHWHAIGVSADG